MKTILISKYDSAKSFYNKAIVEEDEKSIKLYSYNTLVAEIRKDLENTLVLYGWFSVTTARHINEFIQQNGFNKMSKAEINAYITEGTRLKAGGC